MALEKQSCIINPGHQGGKNRFTTRLNPMEPLSLVWGPRNKNLKINSSTAKLGIRAGKEELFHVGKSRKFFQNCGERRATFNAGVLLGSGIAGQAATSPKNQGKIPQKLQGKSPKTQGKSPKTAGKNPQNCRGNPPILLIQQGAPRAVAQEMFGLQH